MQNVLHKIAKKKTEGRAALARGKNGPRLRGNAGTYFFVIPAQAGIHLLSTKNE
jgi:hypothetical protein